MLSNFLSLDNLTLKLCHKGKGIPKHTKNVLCLYSIVKVI
jgi:hypothetical protein